MALTEHVCICINGFDGSQCVSVLSKVLDNSTDASLIKPKTPERVDHFIIRETAKIVAPAGDWSSITHELTEVNLGGEQYLMLTFLTEFYGLSFQGVYAVKRSNWLQDLDEMASQSAAEGIAIQTSICGFILMLMLYYGAQQLYQLSKEQSANKKAKQEIVERASQYAKTCQFGMCMMDLVRTSCLPCAWLPVTCAHARHLTIC